MLLERRGGPVRAGVAMAPTKETFSVTWDPEETPSIGASILVRKNKAQRPTMRPQELLGISSYRDMRDARRKSEYGDSPL